MFKKTIGALVALFVLFCSQLNAEITYLPSEFSISQRVFSWTSTMDIESDKPIAILRREIFSLMPEFHLNSPTDELLAKARQRMWCWTTTYDVTDCHEGSLGSFHRQFTFFFPTFEIQSPSSEKLAEAQLNFWGTTWTLYDSGDGHTIATLSRPVFSFINGWTVNILEHTSLYENKIHPHMFLTFMAYLVDKKYRDDLEKVTHHDATPEFMVTEDRPLLETLTQELACHKERLYTIEPSEADFLYIESLPIENEAVESSSSRWAKFHATASYLLDLLSSDQLSESQKAALFLMLEYRLEEGVEIKSPPPAKADPNGEAS